MKNLYLCESHNLLHLDQRGSINGSGIENDHVLVGLEALEGIGGQEVVLIPMLNIIMKSIIKIMPIGDWKMPVTSLITSKLLLMTIL